jgi:hypothetical protein
VDGTFKRGASLAPSLPPDALIGVLCEMPGCDS